MGAQGSVTNAKEDTVFLGSGTGPEANPAYYAVYRAWDGAFFADTTDAGDAGTNDTWGGIFSAGVGDRVYVAQTSTYNSVNVSVGTAYVGGPTAWTWKYWNGSEWADLSNVVDTTNIFSVLGPGQITFDVPDDWATTTVNGQGPYYWVAGTTTAKVSVSTLAMLDYARTQTAIGVDLSQMATGLTHHAAGGYELTSARSAISGATGREVYARCVLTSGEADKILVAVASTDAATTSYAIGTDGSGLLYCRQGAAAVWTGPSCPAGDLSFAWSTRPNPDTTGASDAMLSEVAIYNHTAGSYVAIEQFKHAVATVSAGYTLTVGGIYVTGSGMLKSPATAPTKVRISAAWHPHTEFAEDWIAARATHTHTLDRLVEPLGADVQLGAQAEWAGQANVGFAAEHANELRGRMLSPLIAEVYAGAPTLTSSWTPAQWWMPAPGQTAIRLDVTKLRKLSVKGVRYAQVRVQVQSWVTTGSEVPVEIRCYAMNRPHVGLGVQLEGQPMPGIKYAFAADEVTVDHGASGVGEWLDLGPLELPALVEQIEGWTGTVTLALGYAIDPNAESANDANARLRIKAWTVLPIVGEP